MPSLTAIGDTAKNIGIGMAMGFVTGGIAFTLLLVVAIVLG